MNCGSGKQKNEVGWRQVILPFHRTQSVRRSGRSWWLGSISIRKHDLGLYLILSCCSAVPQHSLLSAEPPSGVETPSAGSLYFKALLIFSPLPLAEARVVWRYGCVRFHILKTDSGLRLWSPPLGDSWGHLVQGQTGCISNAHGVPSILKLSTRMCYSYNANIGIMGMLNV